MKTFIIQLENHDDVVSARDKMSWAKGGRILLVWPVRGHPLNRRLDLRLLQRAASRLGAQLALVSQDSEVRYHAPRLGIPVFRTLRKAQNAAWRLPRRFRTVETPVLPGAVVPVPALSPAATEVQDEAPAAARQLSPAERLRAARPKPAEMDLPPAARLIYFLLGVLALLAIAAVLVPSAAITITPQTQVQEMMIDVWAQPGAAISEVEGSLPARWITTRVEGRDQMPAGGKMLIADRAALGEVEFTNLTELEVTVPAGTVVLMTGDKRMRFETLRSGSLSAGPGSTSLIPVRALDPGPAGNLPANSLTAIEGSLGVQVSASNPQPTHSGSARSIPAPTAADRLRLAERLGANLEQNALAEFRSRVEPGDLLIVESLQLESVVEESYLPAEGLPSDRLSLSRRLDYRALVVAAADLERLSASIFDKNLPEGFAAAPDSLLVEAVTSPQLDPTSSEAPRYRWTMHAVRRIVARIPQAQAVGLALGRSPDSARRTLQEGLHLEAPPEIRLLPDWWPRLPALPFRIEVTSQIGSPP